MIFIWEIIFPDNAFEKKLNINKFLLSIFFVKKEIKILKSNFLKNKKKKKKNKNKKILNKKIQ